MDLDYKHQLKTIIMHLGHHSKLILASLALSSSLLVGCNNKKEAPQKTYSTFSEMADPHRAADLKWTNDSENMHVSFVSTDLKFPKSEEPRIIEPQLLDKLVGWRGEKVHTEILVWSKDALKNVEYSISNFQSPGHSLDASVANIQFVRYVMTDEFAGGCGYRTPEEFAESLSQDILDPITTMDLEAQTVRPLWVTINIPRSTPPGQYRGEITITADGEEAKKLHLDIEVQNATLSQPKNWDFHLDLWQHPAAVARTEGLEMWSDAHFEALKPVMKMLADAGQKVITTTLNKDPWNNQCFDPYADMITWTKLENGKWSYDYSVFDKWVNLMMDLGVNKMINCYSVVPWNNELHYFDAAGDSIVNIQANPGTEIFSDVWHHFLKDFKVHLTEKGWLDITNIAMDERTPQEMEATIKMLQKEAPELGISYADNQKSYKKYPFVKDISIAAGAYIDPADLKDRQDRGIITTYYVCCSDAFPNMFTFSGPAESVYAGWYALAMNFDGMLRWAYNSWVENPLADSRFITWPAGDTYMVYPNSRSSIRFERLVEGIQDLEKIKHLRKELDKRNDLVNLKRLNETVAKFATIKPTTPYTEMLKEGKQVVNEISEIVGKKK